MTDDDTQPRTGFAYAQQELHEAIERLNNAVAAAGKEYEGLWTDCPTDCDENGDRETLNMLCAVDAINVGVYVITALSDTARSLRNVRYRLLRDIAATRRVLGSFDLPPETAR